MKPTIVAILFLLSNTGAIPAAESFPDADTTGPVAGTVFKNTGDLVIDNDGVVISNIEVEGTITINAKNVTLENFRASANGWTVVNVLGDGATIRNCEINGRNAKGIRGISLSSNDVIVQRCNIHNSEDGIYMTGSSRILIEGNYIHNLQSDWDGPHYDGIATDGGISDVVIRNNTVDNPHGQTSAIMISNYFASVSNVSVESNLLKGGGYTVYSDGQFEGGSISGVAFTGNRLVKGAFGYSAFNRNQPLWQGNLDDTTGKPLEN